MKIFNSIRAWFSGLLSKEGNPMSLAVTFTSTTLTVGSTAQLTPSEAATYTSSDSNVLTVDASGLVLAVAEGLSTITATSAADTSVTASVEFTVTAVVAAAPVAAQPTDLEKLEGVIEKLGLETVKEMKAAIAFIRALA